MRILFIGDIVGSPGRRMLEENLPALLEEYRIDFTIANGENSAGGAGMNRQIFEDLTNLGVDAFTMGNHTWDNRDLLNFIGHEERIIRPANYARGIPGRGWQAFEVKGKKLAVCNLIGRVFMNPAECPFQTANEILQEIRKAVNTPYILVDFHAEATSEKMAMAWYLDGRVSAIFGTHTHIQTNDARIFPKGTAYMTDAGMTGPRDSILGVDSEIILKKMLTQMPIRFEVARGDLQFNGVVVEIGPEGKATEIEVLNFFQPAL